MKQLRLTLKARQSANQAGFTIVELMIALAILSTLLVMSTFILMQIGGLYTKGINQANTQNTARNVINELASQLQLSGSVPQLTGQVTTPSTPQSPPPGSNATPLLQVGVICIGSTRYTYALNHKLSKNSDDHVLWRDTMRSSATCSPLNLNFDTPTDTNSVSNSGVELMPVNTRLTDFSITPAGANLYHLKVTVAYGDDDLVHYTSASPPASDATNCSGDVGTQYCAVSSLSITVTRRIAN